MIASCGVMFEQRGVSGFNNLTPRRDYRVSLRFV